MDRNYLLNCGIPPPLHFEPSPMPTWQPLSSSPAPEKFSDHFLIPNWDKSIDHYTNLVRETLPDLGKSMPMKNPNLPTISAENGFAERAAKLSCFGSRSFNGRITQLGLNNGELPFRSSPLMGAENLPRVLSSSSLRQIGSPMGDQENRKSTKTHMEIRPTNVSDAKFSSNEGSPVSEKIPSESNSKKRKGVSREKSKAIVPTHSGNATKVAEAEDGSNSKRCKSSEDNGMENGDVKMEKETANEDQKQDQKTTEPPKDYIHVRARRGQATDSHSLAERVRREKIGERMKFLQDLVPGCNKVTGKALMLDEIINYVQSLQRQVEFLSMKLASVNPSLDFNMDSLLPKDISQPNGSFPHPTFPLDSLASSFFGHPTQEIPPSNKNPSNLAVNHCSVDPLDTSLCQSIGTFVEEFGHGLPLFPTLCEDDLHSIVQMGFGHSPNRDSGFHSQSFPGSSQTSHMKIEL